MSNRGIKRTGKVNRIVQLSRGNPEILLKYLEKT